MFTSFDDFWVIRNDGLCLFKRVSDEKVSTGLFECFMSAMNIFASDLDNKGLSNFEMVNKRFFLIKEKKILFVANFKKEINPKKAKKVLNFYVDLFFNTFTKDEIFNWDGDTSKFEKFKEKIKNSSELVTEHFQDTFWE